MLSKLPRYLWFVFLGGLGHMVIAVVAYIVDVLSALAFVLVSAVRPSYWPRSTRTVLMRQILFAGVQDVAFIGLLGMMLGVFVVELEGRVPSMAGHSLLSARAAQLVYRDVAPLLVNLVVIARSGSAILALLSYMVVNGEVKVLDAQGLDPFEYILLPRVVGLVVSVCALTVVFSCAFSLSAYVYGCVTSTDYVHPVTYVVFSLKSLSFGDLLSGLMKCVLPASVTAVICCRDGLGVKADYPEIPKTVARGVARCILGLFAIVLLLSLLGQ